MPHALVAVVLLTACGGKSVDDPESARCNSPKASFARKVAFPDHDAVDVRFRCEGALIAGTLTLPKHGGRHPAIVWTHGSGEQPRLTWGAPLVKAVIGSGMAFFSYDKRGVGESEGICCPGNEGHHFNLLAADADGAVAALRSRAEIDPREVGFLGASEAGWVVPLAVSRSNGSVAFTALVDGPAVTTDEEEQWSDLAGEESDNPPALTREKKAELEEKLDPGGFDPVPLIRRMTTPGIWLYGGQDRSIPADKSAATIGRLARAKGRNLTVVVFPKAGHGLLDVPPTDPRAMPTLLAWLRKYVPPRGR